MVNVTTPKSLVLVVGAGASNEANLPTGAELKKQIANALDIQLELGRGITRGDPRILEAYRTIAHLDQKLKDNINPLVLAGRRIRDGMPQAISVDNFIDNHRDDKTIAQCGKLAIVRCILAAEQASKLFVDTSNINNKIAFAKIESTWFNSFFQLLTENCPATDLPARLSQIAIICFNYDRCLEHYLCASLQNYYGMELTAAAEVLRNLEIHHPYGMVGRLPWQDHAAGFEFGGEPDGKKLIDLSEELRTFTEGIDPTKSDIQSISAILASAQRIAFLGFAFHRLNIQLLFAMKPNQQNSRNCPVYATAFGVSYSDCQKITEELGQYAGIEQSSIRIKNELKCAGLFHEYRRSLALA